MTPLEIDVLNLLNKARAVLNLEPLVAIPKGKRHNAIHCPLSNALDNMLVVYRLFTRNVTQAKQIGKVWETPILDTISVALPEPLRQFMREFDAGLLPQLEEN